MPKVQPWGYARAPTPVFSDTFTDPERPEIPPVTLHLRRPLYTERAAILEEAEQRTAAWEQAGRQFAAIDGGGNVPLSRKTWQSVVALSQLQCDEAGKRLPLDERSSPEEFIGWSVVSEAIFEGMLGLLSEALSRAADDSGNSSGTDAGESSAPSVPTEPATSGSTATLHGESGA
jgi:hypothetical protein